MSKVQIITYPTVSSSFSTPQGPCHSHSPYPPPSPGCCPNCCLTLEPKRPPRWPRSPVGCTQKLLWPMPGSRARTGHGSLPLGRTAVCRAPRTPAPIAPVRASVSKRMHWRERYKGRIGTRSRALWVGQNPWERFSIPFLMTHGDDHRQNILPRIFTHRCFSIGWIKVASFGGVSTSTLRVAQLCFGLCSGGVRMRRNQAHS